MHSLNATPVRIHPDAQGFNRVRPAFAAWRGLDEEPASVVQETSGVQGGELREKVGDVGAGQSPELAALTVSVQYGDFEIFGRNFLRGHLLEG